MAAGLVAGASVGEGARRVPWVEKYRPKSMDDISHQDEVVKTLKQSIKTGNLPHLLFYGPPGTGKTSTINAVSRELYGDHKKVRVMELNASDERGIQVVREKIKTFASATVGHVAGLPPFKLIILDEADSLTPEAQAALRRTMETHSKVTRFCLICNYISRIIDPITSRCAKFRFKPLSAESMKARLRTICDGEGTAVGDDVLDSLLEVSRGDLRLAITYMQSAHQLYGRGDAGGDVAMAGEAEGKEMEDEEEAVEVVAPSLTPQHIVEIAGVLPARLAERIWAATSTMAYKTVAFAADAITCDGYSLLSVVERLCDDVVARPDIGSDLVRARISERLARATKALADGADESLQLLDLLLAIQRARHGMSTQADGMPQL